MIGVSAKVGLNRTRGRLNKMLRGNFKSDLARWGQMGVDALSRSTPVDTRLSASSWEYRITTDRHGPRIEWYNTNEVNGTPVVILIQYGHATGTGGYVHGRDFINPAMRPVFDKIANEMRKKVRS